MQSLGSASSAESSTADQSAGYKRREMEKWLSLSPPRNHVCHICDKRFHSLRALGGHQNAHRGQRDKMQDMQIKILQRERSKPRKLVREAGGGKRARSHPGDHDDDDDGGGGGGGDDHVKRARNSTDHEPVAYENEIDLELRLGRSYPPSPTMKVMNFYDFLPITESKGGVGAPLSGSGVNEINNDADQPHAYYTITIPPVALGQPLQLFEMAANEGGGGDRFDLKASVAGGESEPLAGDDEYVTLLCGRSGTRKVSNNSTGLDVTLKL